MEAATIYIYIHIYIYIYIYITEIWEPLLPLCRGGWRTLRRLKKRIALFSSGTSEQKHESGRGRGRGGRIRRLLMSSIKITRTDIAACPFPSRRRRREIDRFLIIAARSFSLDPPWRRGKEGKKGGKKGTTMWINCRHRAPRRDVSALRKARAIDEKISEKDGRFVACNYRLVLASIDYRCVHYRRGCIWITVYLYKSAIDFPSEEREKERERERGGERERERRRELRNEDVSNRIPEIKCYRSNVRERDFCARLEIVSSVFSVD